MRQAASPSSPTLWRDLRVLVIAWIVVVSIGVDASHAQGGVPAKPGDELVAKFKGKKKGAKVRKVLIHLKFFTPRGPSLKLLSFKNAERRRWIKQAKWWVKRINKSCDIKKIAGVKVEDRDRDTLPREKNKFIEHEWLLTGGETTNKSSFLIGDKVLSDLIGTNTSTRFFNIGIFETVRSNSQFADSAGSVPGKYIVPNVMAAKTSMELCDRRHELGHLMGLKHTDGGLMHKNNPPKGASTKSSPWYGDEDGDCHDFLESWCPKIAGHLGL